jgi:hypothetical protein
MQVQELGKIIYLVNVKHMVTKTAVGGTERTVVNQNKIGQSVILDSFTIQKFV